MFNISLLESFTLVCIKNCIIYYNWKMSKQLCVKKVIKISSKPMLIKQILSYHVKDWNLQECPSSMCLFYIKVQWDYCAGKLVMFNVQVLCAT